MTDDMTSSIREIKATLAMENLYLTSDEESALQDFIAGRIGIGELRQLALDHADSKDPKAA